MATSLRGVEFVFNDAQQDALLVVFAMSAIEIDLRRERAVVIVLDQFDDHRLLDVSDHLCFSCVDFQCFLAEEASVFEQQCILAHPCRMSRLLARLVL